MKKSINEQARTVTFTFDGDLAPVVIAMAQLSPECQAYAGLYGLSHNVGDTAALSRAMPDGSVRTITEAMRREAVVSRVDYLQGGATEWDRKGARTPTQNPIIVEEAAKRGITYTEMQAIMVQQFISGLAG